MMALSPDFGPGAAKYTAPGAGNTVSGSYGAVLPASPGTAGYVPPPTLAQIMQQQLDKDTLNFKPAQAGYTQSSGGGSSLVQTGPNLNQIIQMLGLGQIKPPSLADLQSQAANQVNLTLNPQEDALRRLIDQVNSGAANQTSQLNAFGAAQKSDVQSTFDRLKAFTDAATAAGLGRYDQTAQSVDAGNQQTADALAQNGANAQQAVNAELARMGLSGQGSTLDTSRLNSDQSFLQGLAEANRNNAANNLAQEKANYGGVQNLVSQGQQQAGAQAQSQIAQQLLQKLADITNTQQQGVSGYNSQIASLEGQRGAQTQAVLAGLQQAAAQQAAQQQALMLQAISAAQSGMHSVSNPSSSIHVGATPASGVDPNSLAALNQALAIAKYNDSTNNTAASQKLDQQKLAVQIATSGLPAATIQQLLSGSGGSNPNLMLPGPPPM